MQKFNPVKTDKLSIQNTESKIHHWLKNNRVGYNAERWAFPIENYSTPGEYTIPLPPEKDSILTSDELLSVIDGPLPDSWFSPAQMI